MELLDGGEGWVGYGVGLGKVKTGAFAGWGWFLRLGLWEFC